MKLGHCVCMDKLCVRIFIARQRLMKLGKHACKMIESTRNQNVKLSHRVCALYVCKSKLCVRIFIVRKRPQKFGHCVCMNKLSVNSVFGMKHSNSKTTIKGIKITQLPMNLNDTTTGHKLQVRKDM